uniref:Uncharacterized protein LOC108053230 n=1 Tax=Drosophila rhopaloa TaxID=1041015 RepID=A0A6P4FUU2_DRORH
MNSMIILFPGYLYTALIILGNAVRSDSYAVNKSSNVESHDWSYPEFGKVSMHSSGRRPEKMEMQRYNRDADRNITLKRGVKTYQSPSEKITKHKIKYKTSNPRRKNVGHNYSDNNSDSKHYHTFEEIHEHIEEDDGQYQASEQIGTQSILHENVKDHSSKDGKRMRVKIKHHHHHHHHNHIKEMIKTVPQPYPVEKVVHVPIEKIVEKIVHVPKLVNVTVEKIIHVPIEKIVEKVIHIPKPVHVPKPYVVEKIVEKIVHVPKPYPVLRTVPYPVEIKVPVEKKVPVPFKVEVERKVPIYIRSSEPYKFEPSPFENYPRAEEFKFNMELDHPPPREHEPSSLPSSNYYNRVYKSKELDHPPRIEDYRNAIPPQYNHEYVTKSNIEPTSSGRDAVSLKLVGPTNHFNITGKDLEAANSAPEFLNSSNLDLSPQESSNAFRGIPFSMPFQFVQLQPMAFQNAINMELQVPSTAAEIAQK